ncbi:MAG: hypothetical protein EPN82_05800 [Bacteroidetes bacterium]|nr:MAG: hypothetical protein EPN82_05800 [Bacteroidota bacterium]
MSKIKRNRRNAARKAIRNSMAEKITGQKKPIYFVYTSVLKDKSIQEVMMQSARAVERGPAVTSTQKKAEFNHLKETYGVLLVMNKQANYLFIPLSKLMSNKGETDSELELWATAFLELSLFKQGWVAQDFTYEYVSHLVKISEILSIYPEWLDSLCIMNNDNAERILPEIFALPQTERNRALDEYFENAKSQYNHVEIEQQERLENKMVGDHYGMWIDIAAINALDENEYPMVILDASRGLLPITQAEIEKFKEFANSGINVKNYIDQLWADRKSVSNEETC